LPEPAQDRLGDKPLTGLSTVAKTLLALRPEAGADLHSLTSFAAKLLAALSDIVTRLEPIDPALCRSEFFIELAARSWDQTAPEAPHGARVSDAVTYLQELARWVGTDGLMGLTSASSLSEQLIEIFDVVRSRIPRRVFLARWYPTVAEGEAFKLADLRLKQIGAALRELREEEHLELELVDMGTQTGSTFPIHDEMYEAIASADIILIDLTGVRPNVCVEAGFALRSEKKGRLIFIFQPSTAHPRVPFDLSTFRYEQFADTAEIPAKIKAHIQAIVGTAAIGA
jgi:hypothetical protein